LGLFCEKLRFTQPVSFAASIVSSEAIGASLLLGQFYEKGNHFLRFSVVISVGIKGTYNQKSESGTEEMANINKAQPVVESFLLPLPHFNPKLRGLQ